MTLLTLDRRYEELLAAPVVDSDAFVRSNLHVYRPRHRKMFESVERYLPAGQRGVIADIGCHNGFFLRLSAELGFREFVAVDYFPIPAERSFLSGLTGARFVQTNFNQEDFLRDLPDESVDCVVSTEVIEHVFHYPLGYLKECWRVLKKQGLLLLTTPNPCTLANAARLTMGKATTWGDRAFAITPKAGKEGLPVAVWDIHFREYPATEMEGILRELPGVDILESGFIANADDPSEPTLKRTAKRFLWASGLGNWRPLSATQYWVLRRAG